MVAEHVAAEVRASMARARLAQVDLHNLTGIPQPTLSRKLNPKAERDAFRVSELAEIAEALDVPLTTFFAGWVEPAPVRRKVRGGRRTPIHYKPTGTGVNANLSPRSNALKVCRHYPGSRRAS